MKPIVFAWPPASTTFVAASQNTASAGALILNGAGSNIGNGGLVSVPFWNVNRTVSLTSVNNLSGVTFTVTGTLNGQTVSASLAGPNNNTVYTTQTFNTVTGVSVSGAVTAVSVGSGTTGSTNWVRYNHYATVKGFAVQVQVTAATMDNTITYELQTTMDNVEVVASPALTIGAVVRNATAVADPTTDAQTAWTTIMNGADPITAAGTLVASDFLPNVFQYARIAITAQSATFAGQLNASFMQQGVT